MLHLKKPGKFISVLEHYQLGLHCSNLSATVVRLKTLFTTRINYVISNTIAIIRIPRESLKKNICITRYRRERLHFAHIKLNRNERIHTETKAIQITSSTNCFQDIDNTIIY